MDYREADDAILAKLTAIVEENEELDSCSYIVFYGSPNPDSGRFGPDEYCEEYATPGSDYCTKHQALLDHFEEPYDD